MTTNRRRPLLVRGGDIGEQRRRDLFGDQILQRPGIDKALAGRADLENIGRCQLGVGGAQCVVIARPGKDERRHQRAGAHAGDHRIVRPFAGFAQAVEQAGAERAVGAAARQREPGSGLRRQGGGEVRYRIRPEPRVRHAGNCRGNLVGGRERDARRQLLGLGLRLRRRRFGRRAFMGRCFMACLGLGAAILVGRGLCRERRRHKQRRRQEGRSRINVPSCHIRHSQWVSRNQRKVRVPFVPGRKARWPEKPRCSKNHGQNCPQQDGLQIGPSFAKFNLGSGECRT